VTTAEAAGGEPRLDIEFADGRLPVVPASAKRPAKSKRASAPKAQGSLL